MDTTFPVYNKIWLADDDKDDCELFEDVVKQILPTTSLSIFTDGVKLLNELNPARKPDMLFLDINMPLKDGMECLVEIRAQRHFSRLPIIIFSSSRADKSVDSSYGYGANLYYTKPASFNELLAGLGNLFRMDWSDPFTVTSNHYLHNKFVPYGYTIN